MPRPPKYKEAILKLLAENPIHPTVDWIHVRLRQRHPRVSLATVYRTLRALVAEGTLCELPFGASEARFGLIKTEQHYHFICDLCRRIYDLPLAPRIQLERIIQDGTGHEVSRHTMEFYGRCSSCSRATTPTPPKRRRSAPGKGRRGVLAATAIKERDYE